MARKRAKWELKVPEGNAIRRRDADRTLLRLAIDACSRADEYG